MSDLPSLSTRFYLGMNSTNHFTHEIDVNYTGLATIISYIDFSSCERANTSALVPIYLTEFCTVPYNLQ